MENLKKIIEKLGWDIYEESYGGDEIGWDLRKFSPAGEDFGFSICHNNDVATAIKEISSYAEDGFDIDEHIEMWIEARHNGIRNVPGTRELVEDAENIQKMLDELYNYLLNHVRVCSVCGKTMQEGYITADFEYFCSNECLHTKYSEEEWAEMYDDDNYWTSWEE